MPVKYFMAYILFLVFSAFNVTAQSNIGDKVCGKWKSTDNDLIIQVYMQNDEFRAKIVWFANTEGMPMDYWKDVHNPDPALRNRKILGMSVLSDLKYDADTNTWEGGIVYDSKHGKDWNASAYIDKNGMLRVRGYWHFKFIGRTMTFTRM